MPDAFTFNNGFNAAPTGFQQVTVAASAIGLSNPAKNGANAALLQVETAQIRWRDDGTDPTASVGMLMSPGDPPMVYTGSLSAIKFIRVGATSGTLNAATYTIGEAGR